jgi:hypothetical protein
MRMDLSSARMAIAAAAALFVTAAAADASLTTLAERTGFKQTGRYEEVERLCPAFQARWPEQVRCVEFGRTPEGRPMLALVAAANRERLDASDAARAPVVLMQGGIHAGESDGKDAGLLALREILTHQAAPSVLERVTFVFVPALNADGHERFGQWNRPNQNGPEAMGWRTTAQNLNLNRDYTKAEAPEMRALLQLLNRWDPILYVDLHATDGAQFEHDIAYVVAPTFTGDEQLRHAGIELHDALLTRMTALGSLPLGFYPSLAVRDDPAGGFAPNLSLARFSHEYWARRNRFAVLVETHSWKEYPARVRATRNTIVALLELAATHGERWRRLAAQADARQLGGERIALTYRNSNDVRTVDFRGYAYTREPSAISGKLYTKYDSKRPQLWRVPLRDRLEPDAQVSAPRGGYIVPAGHASWVRDKLRLHGIAFTELEHARSQLNVEVFRADAVTFGNTTFEGRTAMTLKGAWQPEQRDVPAGSLFVPIAQPKARLLMTLLEPLDPDSFLRWGFFNAHFEQKEYMEDYVAEGVAVRMLANDAGLREEFNRRLAADPEFARHPDARLEFFYRRHPSWDERFNMYPILRIEQELK